MLIKRVSLGISHAVCITLSLHSPRCSRIYLLGKVDGQCTPFVAISVTLPPAYQQSRLIECVRLPPECMRQAWLLLLWTSYCDNLLTRSMNRTASGARIDRRDCRNLASITFFQRFANLLQNLAKCIEIAGGGGRRVWLAFVLSKSNANQTLLLYTSASMPHPLYSRLSQRDWTSVPTSGVIDTFTPLHLGVLLAHHASRRANGHGQIITQA